MAYWRHHDPELSARAAAYVARAAGGFAAPMRRSEGASRDEVARDFRAYLADRAYQIARLVGTVEVAGDAARIDPYPGGPQPAERMAAARDLYAPIEAYARLVADAAPYDPQAGLETSSGGAADVGALPVVAVVAIAIASVAAIGLVANQAALLVDRHLEREERVRSLAILDASTHQAVDKHLKREEVAGKALPIDPALKAQLDALQRAADRIAEARKDPFPSVLDSSAVKLPALGVAGGALLLAAAAAAFLFLDRK